MSGFRANMLDAIVFNDVARIGYIILKYKALFQGTSIPTTVAESTTNMHSYKVNTHKNPIIITIHEQGRRLGVSSNSSIGFEKTHTLLTAARRPCS